MGIQSFKFPVDFLNNLEKPIIYIANKHKEILASVAVYDNLSLTCNLNAYQTASFKIYQYVDGVKQDYFKLFEEEMLIMIPGISWYEIHVETNIEPTGISKSITANSLECRLCDKRLVDFQINCNDLDIEDYAIIPFCNFSDPEHSLLHKVLNVSPTWSVGHVDESLINKQRTFDVDDTDVYSFLTSEVSEAFNCLFTFDTFNQTVNAYDLDNYGLDTNIFVSMDNLAQNMTKTIDENSIFTCYRVNGGDDIQIGEVNPNGTNKIYNFEYYLPQMPQELQIKIKAYNEKYQSEKPHYEDVVDRMRIPLEAIRELYTREPDSATSTDWTTYGLYELQSMEKQCDSKNQAYCASGYNQSTSLSYNLYKENLRKLDEVKAEIKVRQSQIDAEKEKWKAIDNELIAIQQEFNMDNWFTLDEWKMLDNYVIEETYSNDNFGAVDNTDEAELFSMEKQLYDKAWKDLSKKCRPQYQYSATLSNVLTIPEFKDFIPYFELGNFIRMETDYDTVIKLRLISFTVDYSNTQTINVTFSDAIRVKDVYEDSASIQAQANSAAMSFQFNKDQYDKSVREGNFVSEMRKYGLDVATTNIHNSSNQSQIWDSTGMTFRQWNEQKQDYDPEMAKIINNMMVFSDDGMKTVRMGIGKIFLPNGESSYGINGETILGKLYLGEYLTLQNDSGTYKFDDSGFSASNGKNTIKIQPNKSEELFSIYKDSRKQVYINSNGDVEFAGSLKSATGTFSGLISGGSININNTFTVDKDGHMIASSGTFGGLVSGGSININDNFVVDSSGRITANVGRFGGLVSGGSININDNFTVDKYGNMIALSGTFGGLVSGGSININDKFIVDKYGNVTATDGRFSGDITGATGTFAGNISAESIDISAYSGMSSGGSIKVDSSGVFLLGQTIDITGDNLFINGAIELNDIPYVIGVGYLASKTDISNLQSSVESIQNSLSNININFNSYKTKIQYTTMGNIRIDYCSGYIPETSTGYGNIAATGWVHKVVNSAIDAATRDILTIINNALSDYATKSWCNSTFKKK